MSGDSSFHRLSLETGDASLAAVVRQNVSTVRWLEEADLSSTCMSPHLCVYDNQVLHLSLSLILKAQLKL